MLIKSPHKPWRKGRGDQDDEHSQKYLTNLSKKNGKTYPGQIKQFVSLYERKQKQPTSREQQQTRQTTREMYLINFTVVSSERLHAPESS